MTAPISPVAESYVAARDQFLAACAQAGAVLDRRILPGRRGIAGEELTMDVARVGPDRADAVLIVSAGTHGIEGYCGNAGLVALLRDDELLGRARSRGVAILALHGVNPYGFSYGLRTNEDNIDLNRNAVDFADLPVNAAYADIHDLLVPPSWPPGPDNAPAIATYVASHGEAAFRQAMSGGQYTHPNGLFYGGRARAWSVVTLQDVLDRHLAGADRVAWIDIHTGLGPWGHGEKIYAGRDTDADLAQARAAWGCDVFSPRRPGSVSANVSGPVVGLLYDRDLAVAAAIGLEFGTVPFPEVTRALRASTWAFGRADLPATQRREIAAEMRRVFLSEDPVWLGMILGQTRLAALQAITAIGAG